MRQHSYWVYILASESGTLYTGVTNNIERRVYEHKHATASDDGWIARTPRPIRLRGLAESQVYQRHPTPSPKSLDSTSPSWTT
ncbi:MAG: GIY-YIG nuclease family protein, partial [Planctomycetes bacterium]|nr:GIY-YIG nuclease family protein [Planctomycetota bacterium]